ncbi:hypothetical protein [Streptomyces sp. NBRC 110465]|uniref:hypothetical protein n=1 Tax=Streptomyces sp. NBRC 110465 TaxID=1897621 RepID=UPI0009350C22|nr:hypothetical protein [Streptomyces sp. NBRC 110465]
MSTTDEHWHATYTALDSSTLLALLPVLREGKERAAKMVEMDARHHQDMEGTDAYTAQLYSEALAAFDARIAADDPARKKLAELRDKVHEVMGGQVQRTAKSKRDMRTAQYLWAHQQREQWIIAELTRRGILPEFPQKLVDG